ncbi:hypothetical protein FVER53590_25480 [Fusarium verticillioides]|nr:hypothetical protein FVER53590_25480 [Fusarium verticillioides]
MGYVLNILKLMVPWKKDIDAWRAQEDITKINNLSPPAEDPGSDGPPFPNPPSTPPSYKNLPAAFAHEPNIPYFPHMPAHIARYNPYQGRHPHSVLTPASPTTYCIPQGEE